jgi:hypothetical protein
MCVKPGVWGSQLRGIRNTVASEHNYTICCLHVGCTVNVGVHGCASKQTRDTDAHVPAEAWCVCVWGGGGGGKVNTTERSRRGGW